jgi:hypothetical protein
MIKLYKTCNVSINEILHVDKAVYEKEGYAGKPVFSWPIYDFFKLYHSGQIEKAQQYYAEWYIEQYNRYSGYAKSQGGMKRGTLDRLYNSLKNSNNGNISFESAVQIRVKQRFYLFEKILAEGYIPNHKTPIQVLRINYDQFLIISGGHHRVAIMAAIGYKEVPMVYVFMNRPSYFLNKYSRKGKSILNFKKPSFLIK